MAGKGRETIQKANVYLYVCVHDIFWEPKADSEIAIRAHER